MWHREVVQRVFFLFMATAQVLFAFRALANPQAAKNVNIRRKTIWAKFPVGFYRSVGVICTGAAIWFLYLFLHPPD